MKTHATPPSAAAARKPSASACVFMTGPSSRLGRGGVGGIQRRREPFLFAVIARPLPESRTADPGGAMFADDLAVGVLADHVVEEDVLGDDGVAFHAHHLGNVGDPARTI